MENGNTLDLSNIKLTAAQFAGVLLLTATIIGTTAVSLYQLSELRRGQSEVSVQLHGFSDRLGSLELDKARREGAEAEGKLHPEQRR